MNDLLFTINFSVNVAAFLIALNSLFACIVAKNVELETRRFFTVFFSILILYAFFSTVSQITGTYFHNVGLLRFTIFMHSLLSSLLIPMLTIYLLHTCREDWKTSPLFKTTFGLWIIYLLLLIYTQFTNQIYYVTPNGEYLRGPYYPVLLVPPVLIMAVNIIGLIRRKDKLPSRYFFAFLIYFLIPMISMLIQMVSYGLLTITLGTTLGAVILYFFIVNSQAEKAMLQQEENNRLQAANTVLQMRPHFIYNTMTSIYYLIQQNPEKAQQVTLDFTTYLRKNFAAIAKDSPIPFTSELEHTKAYLAVEQVRFEGDLFVTFDTPHTSFLIPPLTLQPIVENAVKYGVDPELEPMHLTIITRKTDHASEITVKDTGPGFRTVENGEPHIALENIAERLQSMCRGSLTIESQNEKGTTVRIVIPD
ncbi:MAG: histidine kinase [Solobacterium sp.]|nr:histidine kinase [Solobacterium sp.]